MNKKIVKNFAYSGLGFPIELAQVEMVKIDDDWHPKIDVRKVTEAAIKVLATQKERLTGNQVKFIRSYFSMSLRDFAKDVVHESHTAVSKWESFGNKVTNMDINIEMILRLYILEKTELKTTKQQHGFYQKYQKLKQIFSSNKNVSRVHIQSRVT